MFVVSFNVALHCKKVAFFQSGTPHSQCLKKRLQHFKKIEKSLFVCFLHFLELEGPYSLRSALIKEMIIMKMNMGIHS